MSPDPRVKWGSADKTKHGPYFISLRGQFFLYMIFSGWGQSSSLNKCVLSYRLQQIIKKIADGILSLTDYIFKRSEARYELFVSLYIMSFLGGQFHWYFECEKHFYSLKDRFFFFYSSSDTLWKISFCKFLLCMTLTCILSNLPYFDTKRPVSLFLSGSAV
jgi:hypothetical protein